MTQPEAFRLTQVAPYLEGGERGQWIVSAAAELRRLHDEVTELQSDLVEEVLLSNAMLEVKEELLAALKVAALAIHEYRTQGAPCAYWDDVEYQAAEAIAKGEAR